MLKAFWLVATLAYATASMAVAQPAAPGIYAAVQAAEGAALYARHCADCHGVGLEGGAAPALRGASFAQMMAFQKLSPTTLMAITAQTMPQGAPASLSRENYLALTAYMLKQNGYAPGATPFEAAAACADCNAPVRVSLAGPAAAPVNDHAAPPPAVAVAAAAPETLLAQPVPATRAVASTDADFQRAQGDQNNWLLHGRTYDNQRFSPLTRIDTANVRKLRPAAIIQTGVLATMEATPIVVDGVMYVSTSRSGVQAYDAATGKPFWRYTPQLGYSQICCGPQSRGVAVAYGKVYVAQVDGKLVALDARDGKVLWRTDPAQTLPPDPHFYSFTLAPQVYDGMVIVGNSGAEWPTRGFVQAYDAQTGKLLWRFHTTAAPDEPGGETWEGDSWKYGGGSVWSTPAIDVEQGLVIFATGNPNPDYHGEIRKGDNAYTVSIVAVHARTGKLAWWYQMVPHYVWDYDAASPVVLFNARDASGNIVPAAGEASKEGHLWIVDRRDGKLIRKSEPFVLQSPNKFIKPTETPLAIYPGVNGGNNWSPAAFSPLTGQFYVPGTNQAWSYVLEKVAPYVPGTPVVAQNTGGSPRSIIDPTGIEGAIEPSGTLSGIDVNTGRISWQYKSRWPMSGGILATAGHLVFAGELNGDALAFDARTGEKLWSFNLGAGIGGPPVTYQVDGVQYVAFGASGYGAGGMSRIATTHGLQPFGDVIAIFSLTED